MEPAVTRLVQRMEQHQAVRVDREPRPALAVAAAERQPAPAGARD
jgi:hypothetical protein